MAKRLGYSAILILVVFLFHGTPARAFCNEFTVLGLDVHCDGDGHQTATNILRPVLRPFVLADIRDELVKQDRGAAASTERIHFDSCQLREGSQYINAQYRRVIDNLDPNALKLFAATDEFGKLLHPVQDFYAHSNWIELFNLSTADDVDPSFLFQAGLGNWDTTFQLNDIILGELPLAAGASVSHANASPTPIITDSNGRQFRGLVTGWNPPSGGGRCPDVRAGSVLDQHSINNVPRTTRLVHGGGKANRPCRENTPTHVCLNKDENGRPGYGAAITLAKMQTMHEWCRLLTMARQSRFGHRASSILMGLWVDPRADETARHQGQCAPFRARPGPVEVTFRVENLAVNLGQFPVTTVFVAYTADFRRSRYSKKFFQLQGSLDNLSSLSMCLDEADTVIASLQGWQDRRSSLVGVLNASDHVLRGSSREMSVGDLSNVNNFNFPWNGELGWLLSVRKGGSDPDGDGLNTRCAEAFYGTDPNNPDTDGDGASDGFEVKNGRNPLVADASGHLPGSMIENHNSGGGIFLENSN